MLRSCGGGGIAATAGCAFRAQCGRRGRQFHRDWRSEFCRKHSELWHVCRTPPELNYSAMLPWDHDAGLGHERPSRKPRCARPAPRALKFDDRVDGPTSLAKGLLFIVPPGIQIRYREQLHVVRPGKRENRHASFTLPPLTLSQSGQRGSKGHRAIAKGIQAFLNSREPDLLSKFACRNVLKLPENHLRLR